VERQHLENLFRRYKGKLVTVRSIPAACYKGQVGRITNDYVLLTTARQGAESQVFVIYGAIESIVVSEQAS